MFFAAVYTAFLFCLTKVLLSVCKLNHNDVASVSIDVEGEKIKQKNARILKVFNKKKAYLKKEYGNTI